MSAYDSWNVPRPSPSPQKRNKWAIDIARARLSGLLKELDDLLRFKASHRTPPVTEEEMPLSPQWLADVVGPMREDVRRSITETLKSIDVNEAARRA